MERSKVLQAPNLTRTNLLARQNQSLNSLAQSGTQDFLYCLYNTTITGVGTAIIDNLALLKRANKKVVTNALVLAHRDKTVWNESSIEARAKILAGRAILVCKKPELSQEIINIYREPEKENGESVYSIEDYEYLNGDIFKLCEVMEKRILNLDSSVRVEFKKKYIAFKVSTNFVDIVPQKRRLRLSLNADFDEIKDPNNLCKDVSGLGRWGNGDVEIGVDGRTNLDTVISLIQQAKDIQLNTD